MKKMVKIVGIVLGIIILGGIGFITFLSQGLKEGIEVTVNEVSVERLDDGTYSGEYDEGRWSNKVEVTIKDHKIQDIKVVDDVTFSKEEVKQEILKKVMDAQNTDVDAIAGSTITSKAYLKAIEDALK